MQDSPPSLTHRAFGGMVWVAWGAGATAVLKLVVLVVLTRLLTPADFGVVGAALIVIGFSLTFSQLGLGPALVQRPALGARHVSTAFAASTGFGVLVAAVIWFGAPLLARFFRMDELTPIVRALALLFPIKGASAVAEHLLQRELRFRSLANVDVATYAVGYGLVGIVGARLGWGAWALVVAQLTQTTLRAAAVLAMAPPALRPGPSWESFRELMGYGAGHSAAHIGVFLANQADNLVVGRWLGAVSLGLYTRAYQLMAVPTALLGDVLDNVLFPTMARVQDDPRRLATAYLQGTAMLSLVMLPAGVVVAVLAPDLVAVAFGERWAALVPPFQILALGMMFRTSYRLSDSLSRATGRVYRRAWRQWLYAALVFAGAWIGHFDGVIGVAAGVLGALFVNYLLMAHLGLQVVQTGWRPFLRAQLPALRLALLLGAVTVGATVASDRAGLPAYAGLAVGVAAAAGTAALLVWRAPALTLGEHGLRMRDLLRERLRARLRPAPVPGSA